MRLACTVYPFSNWKPRPRQASLVKANVQHCHFCEKEMKTVETLETKGALTFWKTMRSVILVPCFRPDLLAACYSFLGIQWCAILYVALGVVHLLHYFYGTLVLMGRVGEVWPLDFLRQGSILGAIRASIGSLLLPYCAGICLCLHCPLDQAPVVL